MITVKINITRELEETLSDSRKAKQQFEAHIKQHIDSVYDQNCVVFITNDGGQSIVASGGSFVQGVTQINNR